jgi:hypothetical protein
MIMQLWAHHIDINLFGTELSPETPMEHAVFFAVTTVALGLMCYGAYAVLRDLRRWRAR